MVRTCRVDCGYCIPEIKLKKKNPTGEWICTYGGGHSSVQFGKRCQHGLLAEYESRRGIAEGVPFSRISSLAGLLR